MANSWWNPYARRRKLRRLVNWLLVAWALNMIFLVYLISRDK
jgi:hypothetical protein